MSLLYGVPQTFVGEGLEHQEGAPSSQKKPHKEFWASNLSDVWGGIPGISTLEETNGTDLIHTRGIKLIPTALCDSQGRAGGRG